MRKIISIVMAAVMCLGLIGCGDTPKKDISTKPDTKEEKKDEKKEEKKNEEKKYPDEMSWDIGDTFIGYNYFKDMTNYSELFTTIFVCVDGKVMMTRTTEETPELSLSELPAAIEEDFIFNVETEFNSGYPQKVVVEKSEEVKINDIKALKFEGYVATNGKRVPKFPIFGYYFWKNNHVYQLIGTHTKDPLTEGEQKDKLKKRVDMMMGSVRNYGEK